MIKTCSKESGQRLVELGVTKESYFKHDSYQGCGEVKWCVQPSFQCDAFDGTYPAYTACELGEMLPEEIEEDGHLSGLKITKYGGRYEVGYVYAHGNLSEVMAETMALTLIWLLESGHITAEEVNA